MTLDPYTQLGEFDGGSIGIEHTNNKNAPFLFTRMHAAGDGGPDFTCHDTLHEAAQAAAQWIQANWPDAPDDVWHRLNRIVSDDLAARGLRELQQVFKECAEELEGADADSGSGALQQALEAQKQIGIAHARMSNMINRGTVRGVDPRAVVVHAWEDWPEGAGMDIGASAWLLLGAIATVRSVEVDDLAIRAEGVQGALCHGPFGFYSPEAVDEFATALRAELQAEDKMGPEALFKKRDREDPGRVLEGYRAGEESGDE